MKFRILFLIFIGIIISICYSCEDDSTGNLDPQSDFVEYKGLSGEIGFGGGTIEVNNESSTLFGTVIQIPEGALNETVNITIREVQSPVIFESNDNEIAIKLEPEGTEFNKPISITMPYSSVLDASSLKIFYYNSSDSSITQMQISQTIEESNLVSFSTGHFSIYFSTGNSLNVCTGEIPNEDNVKAAITDFDFDGTSIATRTEAIEILKHLCPLVSIHYPDENTVCGKFPSGYHLTLWVGTYGNTDRYGARYGIGEGHSYWGSNDTYFEIIKPYDISFDFCDSDMPNESNVLTAIQDFTFDGSYIASHTEAEDILNFLCSDVSFHYPADDAVCGEFPNGVHLTLWVGTYEYTDRYGARYGSSDHSYWGNNDTYFEIVKPYDVSFDFCDSDMPNESNVLTAIQYFNFDGSGTANHTEAENILKFLCSSVSIHYPAGDAVCGEFPNGVHLTLWVGTYGLTDRYGARYGSSDHSYWGNNDTYFEIVKP